MVHQTTRLKIKRSFKLNRPILRLGLIVFSGAIAFSLISTVWSLYLNSFFNNPAYVGLFSSFLMFISFLSYFLIIPLIEKSNKIKLSSISLVLLMIGYFSYSLFQHFSLLILVALIVTVAASIKITSLGLLIEHNSKKKNLSENEGLMYTFSNFAYVLGPLIAGVLLAIWNINSVFIFGALFLFVSVIILNFSKIKDAGIKKRLDTNPFKNFFDFFKDKNRRRIYYLSAGLTFWWSLIFIYMPLMIIQSLEVSYVGYFLFAVVIPLVCLEYYFGKLACKRGYKPLFFIGFLIPGILCFICFLSTNIFFIMSILVMASIGLAMTESTTESYFFDIMKRKQSQRYYAPYNTALDIGGLTGELIAGLVLLFLNMKFIFLIYGIGMLILSIISLKIKRIIESRRKN